MNFVTAAGRKGADNLGGKDERTLSATAANEADNIDDVDDDGAGFGEASDEDNDEDEGSSASTV
jgi:hypothetical protein